ncbi:uncharacterized protein LOC115762940 isoform X1 [Drosophila novamexicana]|uniref:uncharacterized protein LOC115762940 isoform X1 n=1 Tax=Drosophila novamexicana TaxID=47314 RepID=UPI0011E5E5CD|nr:uncharacterized protein LOC115762940 isoform X1 [Drosophila novamexicana]
MILRALCLGLALLVLALHESLAYQPGSYSDGQSAQSGLSASTHSNNAHAQEQPIYERDTACPPQFRGLKPYAHDCHRFISCANGRSTIQTCSPGTAFNALTGTCDHLSQVACEGQAGRSARLQQLNTQPKCAAGLNGLQPHPYDCTKFLNCANGQTFIQNCGPGTAFSPSMLVCDYKHKVDCGDGRFNVDESAQGQTGGTSGGLTCPEGARGQFPYPNDPYKYVICGIGVQPRLEQCPSGKIFDGHSLICIPIGALAAQTDFSSTARLSDLLCPGGVEGLFVHPFDQTKFLNCKAGKVAVQSCIPGHVFSISKGYCQLKAQSVYSDYVTYIVSEISYEYSLMLTRCPAGTDGLHLYPYDAGKYVRCEAGGGMSILSCGEDMAYSFTQRACRPRRQVTRAERVKFFSELSFQGGSYSYTDSQAFQSGLKSCPPNLRGNYAYPFHAGHFVLCQNGLLQVESCPAGSVYSLSTRRCAARQQLTSHDFLDYAYINIQLSTDLLLDLTTVTCPANAVGYYLHPFDCTKFLNCRDQQTSIESCEKGEVFSISQRRCVARDELVSAYDRVEYLTETQHEFSQEHPVAEGRQLQSKAQNLQEEATCPPGASGLHKHPYDCTKFLNCANGQTFIQDCGPGTAFSASLLVCDFKDKVDCGEGRSYTGEGEITYSGYSGHVSGSATGHQGGSSVDVNGSFNGASCPEGARGLFPYFKDPHKYVKCGIGVQPRLEQCQSGEVFDSHSLICVPTGALSTQTDFSSTARLSDLLCPGGVEGLFVHPFDQTKFLNCKAGKVAVQSCISGHVFSISKGYCQLKAQSVYSDYVTYIVSEISYEYSLMLTRCPAGTDGLHLYPYDAGKYVRCEAGGGMSILSCGQDMAYSFTQRACRPRRQVTRAERVKFFSELSFQGGNYSYTDSQAFQSGLKSCPPNLRGNYAYPFHAGHFVLCQNGLLQVESCPAGSVYSLSTRRCAARQQLTSHDFLDYAYINIQLSTDLLLDLTTVTCPANAVGYYLHPFDCTKFLNCRDQQTSIESCEKGEVFSISQRRCVARDELVSAYDRVEYLTETQHEFSQEHPVAEGREPQFNLQPVNGVVECLSGAGGLQPHPYDCTKFLNCANGQTFVQDCEPGTAFNRLRGDCDHAAQVNCAQSIINPNTYPTTVPSYRLACPVHVYGLYAHPFDAKSYLYCDEGHTTIRQCLPNEVFSLSRGYCLSAELVLAADRVSLFSGAEELSLEQLESISCPHAAVGNHAYPFDCTQYLSCEAGITRLQSCPNGQHFSLSQRRCQPQEQVQRIDRVYRLSELQIFYEWWQQLQHVGASVGIRCPFGLTGNYQHPTLPHKFISCAAQTSEAVFLDCPAGQVFSVSRRLCVPGTQVPTHDRCDYQSKQALNSYGWIDLRHDAREPKAYVQPVYGGADQYGSGSGIKTTVVSGGSRWSDMNMERPSGIGFGQDTQQTLANGWSGQGSSYNRQAPTQSVLYVEGSLLPNRNYQPTTTNSVYKTPLAPMAPTTSNVYYAQPVETVHSSRQNFSRSQTNDWHTARTPYNPQSSYPQASLPGQQPLDLDYQPDGHAEGPRDQLPSGSHQQPREHSPYPSVPTNHKPTFHGQSYPPAVESNLYGGLQPPTPPAQPSGFTPIHPQSNPPARALPRQRPLDLDDYNPDVDTQATVDQPYPTFGQAPAPVPSVPANHSPTYRGQPHPVANESNLYGGLQPPSRPSLAETTTTPTTSSTPSNLRTFPIYPRVFNATPANPANHPHYSPPYAAVAHSQNASWQKVPPRAREPDPFMDRGDYDEADYGDSETTTTERIGLRPPPFNHQFYNPPQGAAPAAETPSKVALGEALRLMLRPYFNHSGNAQEALAERAESAIASAISKPPTSTTPIPTTTTTIKEPHRGRQTPDDEVELIVAGEQESLDIADDDSVVPDAGETARTEQTLNPTTYASGYDTTDFQRGTRRVDTDSSTQSYPNSNSNNWHAWGHSREFHKRHPNMPDPFDKPEDQHQAKHQHHPHHPHHHHHHHPHEHSRLYHSSHPNLPNPFSTKNEEHPQPKQREQPEPQPDFGEEPDFLPNPNAEATTSRTPEIRFRSGFDEPCEFDCGGGKCVKKIEVCDGVNNCGNRRDEHQCDHLGYQVRLTGGESPHMGRIEVKVNGQWGYVCDDKFGLRDADVVCRELGFKMGAAEVRGNSYYEPPERNFNYAMDELECRGNETKLKDCDFKGWGVHNCGVDEVVGVVCKVPVLKCPNNFWLCQTSKECIPPAFVCDHTEDCADKSDESDAVCKAPIEYRLEGGRSPIEGRLEVKYHGVWGSVCDDDFNIKAAQVACNNLGYYGAAKIEKNIFGPGSGPIWLDQVLCQGNETSIDMCRHWNWGEHNCNHTEDVGLRCTAGPPPRQSRQRTRLQALDKDSSVGQAAQVSLSDIGLWERSSKALRTPRRCGIFKDDLTDEFAHPEQRVVQGSVARRGRHPWQATIRTRGRGGISSHWCGAVVISKRHLLTAAHCLYGHPKGAYFVRVGDHYANIAEHSEVDAFIENWYTHEQFRQPTHMNNDIAVVVLKAPLKFSDYVQPICLPERGAPLVENRTCTISGWGSIKSGMSTPSQELRAAQLPILPDATCKQMNVYGDAMTEGMFCAGSMDESVDACEGDSGGPLVCSDEDGETLYGIISWGQHCGYQNRPGVYVRVCHYIDWIYEKINQSMLRF